MPFPRKLLDEGEDVVLDLHPHWRWFARPVAVLVLAAAALVVVADAPGAVLVLLVLVVAGAALWAGARYVRWATTNFVVTTERVVYRAGVLRRDARELPLALVGEVRSHQTLLGRLLRCGDLVVEPVGGGDVQAVPGLPRPAQVRRVVQREATAARERERDRDREAGARSVPDQLEKLDELRRRGVVTQAEFDAKKAQLLDRM
jgi:uncharacterized membrane protein YdbT with pleckstrin-like domain